MEDLDAFEKYVIANNPTMSGNAYTCPPFGLNSVDKPHQPVAEVERPPAAVQKPAGIKCQICSSAYSGFKELQRHIRAAHLHVFNKTEKKIFCVICRKAYVRAEELSKHMQTDHKDWSRRTGKGSRPSGPNKTTASVVGKNANVGGGMVKAKNSDAENTKTTNFQIITKNLAETSKRNTRGNDTKLPVKEKIGRAVENPLNVNKRTKNARETAAIRNFKDVDCIEFETVEAFEVIITFIEC